MYLEHFGLEKYPFAITPDTSAFYEGSARGATLNALLYAVEHTEGIVKVVGEVGSGKTTLCRMLPLRSTGPIDWIYLPHPVLEPDQILLAIANELGVKTDTLDGKVATTKAIYDELLWRYGRGRRVVTLVEEAQAIPIPSLEELRLLSNIETDDHKLIQIVLFGQPELDDTLSETHIRQFSDRITHHFNLRPLDVENMQSYLNFRMRQSGYCGPDIFTAEASRLITMYAAGLVRRANIIADKILLGVYAHDRREILKSDVKHAASESQLTSKRRRSFSWRQLMSMEG